MSTKVISDYTLHSHSTRAARVTVTTQDESSVLSPVETKGGDCSLSDTEAYIQTPSAGTHSYRDVAVFGVSTDRQ
jgi:hypothetical protein